MKKCLILLFLIVLFIGIVITKTIIAEPEKESYLVNSVSVPFGFYNDPLPEYVASYTTLPFKDCFYFGPCSINWTGHFAVYGPAWFFAGKKQQGIYWYPFHDWGLSYDTVLKLNTQEMKNKLITNPENFAQWRFRESRHKYWDEYGFVIDNVYFPQWTQDGPLKLANSTPGAESRHSSNGEYFNVWDMPKYKRTDILGRWCGCCDTIR